MSTEFLMRAARAVILDFNGTLAEDEAVLIGIYEELLWEHGVAFDGGDYARYAGLPDKAMFGHLFEARGQPLESATADRLLRERVERYRSAVSDDHPVAEDTVAFVRTVAAWVPVGIASGAFREEIEHVLELAELAEHVSVIVSIDEVRAGKPDPESFTAALAKINRDRPQSIAAEDTIVIEDATDGVRAARAAGMRCVALRGRAYDEDSGLAELVVDRLTAELARTLLQVES
jgi:beta-phosphoglucomutase-like phosphatase (HAD superfamily)